MNHDFPTVTVSDDLLTIRFLDGEVSLSFEVACVLDQSDFGDVIGAEILDLGRQVPGVVIDAPRVSGYVRWSYDKEEGAFYIHVTEGRSQVQTSVTGRVDVDSSQRLVRLEAKVPPAVR